MDHRYIDDQWVTERYLGHLLTPAERVEFETHLVDCQECTDRVLLAEMFRNRNGTAPQKEVQPANLGSGTGAEPDAQRLRFVRLLAYSWQLFLILAITAALLVLVPSLLLLWVLGRLHW